MAIIYDKTYGYPSYDIGAATPIKDDLSTLWDWAAIETNSGGTGYNLWLDSSKTYGLSVSYSSGAIGLEVSLIKGTTLYHTTYNDRYMTLNMKIEKTNGALILSVKAQNNLSSVSATDCDKFIICNGLNATTKATEPIIIYLGSKSSSNQIMLLAGDVDSPTNLTAQNANANTGAKVTNLIPFYSPSSACITTDVFVSLCEDIASWYFGNVVINGITYRMSGSVFARDI